VSLAGWEWLRQIWEFFYIFSSILQKYTVRKKFAKLYILRRGGRRQGPTVVPHGVTYPRGTVAPATAVWVQSVFKIL
jgi:hypothetical protein